MTVLVFQDTERCPDELIVLYQEYFAMAVFRVVAVDSKE